MKYRKLGKTGMEVSVVAVGTWQYGGEWGKDYSQSEVDTIIHHAGSLGLNLIDTAECYGDHLSEMLVGNAIKDNRHDWIIATKFGHKFNKHLEHVPAWSTEQVRQQLEDSLRALKTDYIDLYQFHSGTNEDFDNDEMWAMLQKQKNEGKIRHLGISIGLPTEGEKNRHQVDFATSVGAEAIQVVYNRLDNKAEDYIFPSCIRQGLGVLARVPLASGFLSGKYNLSSTFPPNDVRASKSSEDLERILKQVDEIRKQELPEGLDMAQWAIAWCLKNEAVSCCIPGFKNIAQLEKGAAVADWKMVSDTHPLGSR